jgi:hypothetical protein
VVAPLTTQLRHRDKATEGGVRSGCDCALRRTPTRHRPFSVTPVSLRLAPRNDQALLKGRSGPRHSKRTAAGYIRAIVMALSHPASIEPEETFGAVFPG